MARLRNLDSGRLLAVITLVIGAALLASLYWAINSQSTARLTRAIAAFDQVSWVVAAEPKWQEEFSRRSSSLKSESGFFAAATPQDAAGEFQAKLRQALSGAGAQVDSLQSSAIDAGEGKLPMLRAMTTARISADRVVDVLTAIEAVTPQIAIESLDISAASAGLPAQGEHLVTLTIAARAYVVP